MHVTELHQIVPIHRRDCSHYPIAQTHVTLHCRVGDQKILPRVCVDPRENNRLFRTYLSQDRRSTCARCSEARKKWLVRLVLATPIFLSSCLTLEIPKTTMNTILGDLRRLHHWRALFEKVTEMVATKIKPPPGSVYMYTCFMVKMRINFGSFRLFGSIWVGGNVQGRILGSLNFWVLQVKGSNLDRLDGCRNGSVSQKVQVFGERSMLMKCSTLCGGSRSSIHFLTSKCFYKP